MQQLLVAAFLLGLSINNYASENSAQIPTIEISEECYKNWQNIKEDSANLAYYLKGNFIARAKENDPNTKPSDFLKWLNNDGVKTLDRSTNLKYMPASVYMNKFVNEHYDALDMLFLKKYNETEDLTATWKCINRYVRENILKKSVGDFCRDMIERDAAKITLAKQGVHIAGNTLILDGYSMSEKEEDMKEVKDALGIVYKK